MTSYEEFINSLDKDTQKSIQVASEIKIERQPLPSIGLTKQLGGGLKYGADHLFWGPSSSGKSLIAYQTLAMAQQNGKVCALLDAEGAFSPEWAERLGINTKELILISEKNMAKATNHAKGLIEKGLDFLLVDSISDLLPPAYFDNDGGVKEMGTTGAIANHAKGVVTMVNILNGANTGKTLILYISQQTTNITPVGGIAMHHGGMKLKHIVTTNVKFGSNLSEKNRITSDVTEGDLVFSKVTGRPVDWFIEKDRGPGMHTRGTYDIYFDGDFVGIDQASELVDYGVQYGIIQKGGAWFTVYGERLQGRRAAIEYVRSNPAVRDTLEGDLLGV